MIRDFVSRHFFYRQHPDTALRYCPVIDLLKKLNQENSRILEIGSGSYGITPYLKRHMTGVDTDFSEPEHPLLHQVTGSALKLPFPDNSYDICLFSDVLEHLPPRDRQKAIGESIRVAKKYVIISGPFGESAFAQDKHLSRHSNHPFFAEHLQYGLPEVSEIINITQKNPQVKSITKVGDYLNLTVREFIMRIYLSGKLGYYFYLKGLMFLVPLLKHLNSPPCYRSIILITMKLKLPE